MGEVIDLAAARVERGAWLSGPARCLACQHKWQAVAPEGVDWMGCPGCHLMRGRFVHHAEREAAHWRCKCGNDLFFITPEGAYCPGCGVEQHGHEGER